MIGSFHSSRVTSRTPAFIAGCLVERAAVKKVATKKVLEQGWETQVGEMEHTRQTRESAGFVLRRAPSSANSLAMNTLRQQLTGPSKCCPFSPITCKNLCALSHALQNLVGTVGTALLPELPAISMVHTGVLMPAPWILATRHFLQVLTEPKAGGSTPAEVAPSPPLPRLSFVSADRLGR
jgi:hypothetical protein